MEGGRWSTLPDDRDFVAGPGRIRSPFSRNAKKQTDARPKNGRPLQVLLTRRVSFQTESPPNYFKIASATAFRSGALMVGLGPSGNGVMPFLATNAPCHPAFMAPNTSHGCAAMSRSSRGCAPRCVAALRYTAKSGLYRWMESTEIDSSKY